MDLSWHVEFGYLPFLFLTGLAAGFVDSIAGGGGLITIPVLLGVGLDPQHALGTNKLQASFGSGSAAWHYARAGAVATKDCLRGFGFSLAGASAGALTVQQLDPGFLRRAIPVLLIAVAAYMMVRPGLGEKDVRPRMPQGWFELIFGVGIGFYDGFFGPGTGTFWAMACVLVLGHNLTKATAYTKVMNFASNLSSLVFFVAGKNVYLLPGLVMGVGQLMGARIGSRMVIAKGTRLIRPIFLFVVICLAAKLFYDTMRLR